MNQDKIIYETALFHRFKNSLKTKIDFKTILKLYFFSSNTFYQKHKINQNTALFNPKKSPAPAPSLLLNLFLFVFLFFSRFLFRTFHFLWFFFSRKFSPFQPNKNLKTSQISSRTLLFKNFKRFKLFRRSETPIKSGLTI